MLNLHELYPIDQRSLFSIPASVTAIYAQGTGRRGRRCPYPNQVVLAAFIPELASFMSGSAATEMLDLDFLHLSQLSCLVRERHFCNIGTLLPAGNYAV
jgi:hypothetical protein